MQGDGDKKREAGSAGQEPDWREAGQDMAEGAAELASDAKRGARRLAKDASQGLRSAKNQISAAYDRTTDTAERAVRSALDYASENPGTAATVTFVAGVGVGMMLSPRSGRSYYGRGVIPMVAVAVAHAVLGVFDQDV